MLPRKNRLKLPVSWQRKDPDLQIKASFFKILVKRNPSSQATKIGFVVNNKVGKAVIRNSVRRKLADQLNSKLDRLNPQLELIFIAYPNISNQSDDEINNEINKSLSKISFK